MSRVQTRPDFNYRRDEAIERLNRLVGSGGCRAERRSWLLAFDQALIRDTAALFQLIGTASHISELDVGFDGPDAS